LKEIKVFITGDGSHSLLNEALNETYHSRHGAVRESQHVFIEHGLHYLLENQKRQFISILEVGFGTGLNALLTITEAVLKNFKVGYTSLETFPIPLEIWTTLNYPDPYHLFRELHQAKWHTGVDINSNFRLMKLQKSLQEVELESQHYDLIYFDAFAPNKQPELWEYKMLEKVAGAIKPGGIFVTYCAKGQLKRDLKTMGLMVESLPGPPGKREMVRAIKP
jgi:tRNA U34 5-methylaminomethyl-2-thiouridine-forming methyltransferase MnmC